MFPNKANFPATESRDTRAYRHSSRSSGSFSPPRDHKRARAVQADILPVTGRCRETAFLAQPLAQEPRESSTTLTRPTIHCDLLRRIGHHRLGLGIGVSTRGHEIECRLVSFVRSAGNDRSKGGTGVQSRLAAKCRSPARSHGQALSGQHGGCGCSSQDESKCPALMTEIKDLVPGLHEIKILLEVVYIRSEAT